MKRPGGTCTRGTAVFWNAALNSGEGGYTSTGTGGTRIPGAEFLNTAAAADPVVKVNIRKLPAGV